MEEDLTTSILAYAAITALVGRRIQWTTRPQGATGAAIVLQKISAPREYTLTSRVGLVGHLVQISCLGKTFLEAKQLARAVMAWADTLTADPFHGAFVENERDTYEQAPPSPAGAQDVFRTDVDLRIQHFSAA